MSTLTLVLHTFATFAIGTMIGATVMCLAAIQKTQEELEPVFQPEPEEPAPQEQEDPNWFMETVSQMLDVNQSLAEEILTANGLLGQDVWSAAPFDDGKLRKGKIVAYQVLQEGFVKVQFGSADEETDFGEWFVLGEFGDTIYLDEDEAVQRGFAKENECEKEEGTS